MNSVRQTYYRILSFLAYIRQWGIVDGIRIFHLVRTRNEPVVTITLPDSNHPLFLRAGTSDIYAFEHVFAHQCYRLNTQSGSAKFIIDCGANVGYSTVYFAQKYPKATVVAIEPDSSNIQLLKRNSEQYKNIHVLHTAVWRNQAHLKITNKNASKWAFTVSETTAEDPEGFKAIGITDVLRQFEANFIDILKIDVEGAEYEMLESGYENWLSKTNVLVIELHERLKPGCEARFNKAIGSFPHQRTTSGENEVVYFNV